DHGTLDIPLRRSREPADVSGTYTLRITAAPECRERLPEQARSRTFGADVTQEGPRLRVWLSGATFPVLAGDSPYNHFEGKLDGDRAVFFMGRSSDWDYTEYLVPDVIEQVSPTLLLRLSGFVESTVTSTGFEGRFSGLVEVSEWPEPPWRTIAS